jgi:hypothetical protein
MEDEKDRFAMNAKSLKAALAGTLLIAFVAGQAVAQEGECPKVDAEANVKALGIVYYPPAKSTVGNFVPAVTVGKVMYLAGNGPKMPDGKFSSASWAQGRDS